MEDIDYTEKIATFNLLVGNNNEEIALNYLTLTNWDETKAAILYNQENKGPEAKLNPIKSIPTYQYQYAPAKNIINNNNINKKPITSPIIYKKNNSNDYMASNTYILPKDAHNSLPNNISEINKYAECEIFKKKFVDSFKIFKTDNRGYTQGFIKIYSQCYKLYDSFINNLKNNVGIMIIYNKKTYNESINILKSIVNNEITKDILNSQTIIIPLISGCLEADKIIKDLSIKIFPTILICLYKNETHIALIGSVINILNNMKLLNEKLFEAHELLNKGKKVSSLNKFFPPIDKIDKNVSTNIINNNNNINYNNDIITNSINNNNVNNSNNINNKQNILNDINNYLPDDINEVNRDSYTYMTDGEILAKQEREMKSLERMEEQKRLEEKRKEREKKEEEEKKKEEELIENIKVKSILNILPEEPSDDNPDKCVILFRFPDGEKVVQRKFLRSNNVSLLYLYIKSLGREIYSESEEQHFSLIQSFPFKNFDECQQSTLEAEGLFPNAVLQIKEFE